MAVNEKPGQLEQKTFRYFWQDGLMEIFGGLMLIACTFLMSRPYTIWMVIMFTFIVVPKIMERIRRKITYPRLGYAQIASPGKTKIDWKGLFFIFGMALIWAIIVLLDGGYSDRLVWYRWSPTLLAMLLLGMFIFIVSKSGSKAYYILAGISLSGAVLLAFFDFEYRFTNVIIYCFGLGGAFIITGITRLIIFLNRYPKGEVVEMEAVNGQ